jgi:hypothetical protein
MPCLIEDRDIIDVEHLTEELLGGEDQYVQGTGDPFARVVQELVVTSVLEQVRSLES